MIKRYLVNTMPEAMEIIKRDLGPEAVIISSRWVKEGGWLGILGPKKLEVTAAVEHHASKKEAAQGESGLIREMAELKALLKKYAENSLHKEQEPPDSKLLLKWQQVLQELEVSHEVTNQLLKGIAESAGLAARENEELFKETVQERMARIFESAPNQSLSSRIFVFVGPTGVGKTTTLAKLAANLALFEQKKIALLTIDTYRIGAVEQLKTYGEILNVPVEAVLTPEELNQAVERHQDKDFILVDTAGRSSRNKRMLAELQSFLTVLHPAEVFLVMSCTTKNKDLLKIADDFKLLNYTKLIFTKADETTSLGSILNLASATSKPVAYVTTGQNVPDDIEACDPQKLVKLILKAVG